MFDLDASNKDTVLFISLLEHDCSAFLTAGSRQVAEKFEKEHKNVVRDIEKLVSEIGSDLSSSYLAAKLRPREVSIL